MKIVHKLILGVMLLASMIWLIGFYAVVIGRQALRDSIENSSEYLADNLINEVDEDIRICIETLRMYSSDLVLQNSLKASNREFEELPDVQAYIDDRDRKWTVASKDELTPFMKDLISTDLSVELQTRLEAGARNFARAVYGEVFATNRFGAIVAETSKTSDYRQDDEEWWQRAWKDGLYVRGVTYDASADVRALDICLRIDADDGTPIGVMKAVLNFDWIISQLQAVNLDLEDHDLACHQDLVLLDESGEILFTSHPLPPGVGSMYIDKSLRQGTSHTATFRRHDDKRGPLLAACARSTGDGEYKGLGWCLVVEYSEEDVFAPITALRNRVLVASLVIAAGALLIGFVTTVSLSRRIAKLRDAAVSLGKGNLDVKVEDGSSDEIGQLALCFNEMGIKLKHYSDSIREHSQELEQRVAERTEELRASRTAALNMMQDAEEARRNVAGLKQQMEFILGATKTGLHIMDPQGNMRYADPKWQELYGDPAGRTCCEYLDGRSKPRGVCEFSDIFKTKKIVVTEKVLPKEAGRPVQVTSIPFQDEQGEWLVAQVIVDITDRKRMEAELTQAQKLESIGQLAAGIAHEINTPSQYIGDNTRFLQEAFEDIDRLLEHFDRLLQAAKHGQPAESLLEDVEAAIEDADLAYLIEEIPKAIRQSQDGVDRVATIVRAMKEFSHPGSDRKQAVDLNRAIENTVTISRNEWKYVADLTTDLDPKLPLVPCHPGEVNQVILNIIVNAAQAINEVVGKSPERKGAIAIHSRCDGDFAEIRISDTGPGIPVEARSRVFDHFFTTKAVGKGTGQGLSIAYAIVVEKHGGAIDFETEPGKGTTFIVRLPVAESPTPDRSVQPVVALLA